MPLNNKIAMDELQKKSQQQTIQVPKAQNSSQQTFAKQSFVKPMDIQPKQQTSYQINLSKPVENQKWYKGSMPTTLENYGRIAQIGEQDPFAASVFMKKFQTAQNTPGTPYFNAYLKPTNPAVANLNAMGVDTSNLDDNWFDQNSYLQQYYILGGTTNTPQKPGKNATAEQQAAYEYYQLAKAKPDSDAYLQESAALQQELAYQSNRPDRNWTDEEIVNNINWDKYPTLNKMRKSRETGVPIELNVAAPAYTDDWCYGSIWAARNDGGTGDYTKDMAMAYLGRGNVYQENPEMRAKLDATSDDYAPYSVGSTLEDEMLYFGRDSFDQQWLDDNRWMLNSNDQTQLKMYQNVWEAEQRTVKAEGEQAKLNAQVDKWIGMGYSEDRIMKKLDAAYEDYPTLRAMDDSLGNADLIGTTRAINYRRADVETRIHEACEAKKSAPSNMTTAKETASTLGVDVPELQAVNEPIYKQQEEKVTNSIASVDDSLTNSERTNFESAPVPLYVNGDYSALAGTPKQETTGEMPAGTEGGEAQVDESDAGKRENKTAKLIAEGKPLFTEGPKPMPTVLNENFANRSKLLLYGTTKQRANANSQVFLETSPEINGWERNLEEGNQISAKMSAIENQLGSKLDAMDTEMDRVRVPITINGNKLYADMSRNTDGSFTALDIFDENGNAIGRVGNEWFPGDSALNEEVNTQLSAASDRLMNRNAEIAAARAENPEFTQEEQDLYQQWKVLRSQKAVCDQYAADHNDAYQAAQNKRDASDRSRNLYEFQMRMLGVDTFEFQQNDTYTDFLDMFSSPVYDHPGSNNWLDDAMSLYLYGEGQAGWKEADDYAKSGAEEIRTMLSSIEATEDYIAKSGMNVPQSTLDNMNTYKGMLQRNLKAYEYYELMGNENFLQIAQDKENSVREAAVADPTGRTAYMNGYLGTGLLQDAMSTEEKAVYYYLLATQGLDSAKEYYDFLSNTEYGVLQSRVNENVEAGARDMVNSGPLGFLVGNAIAIGISPVEAVMAGAWWLDGLIRGKKPNPNNALRMFSTASSSVFDESNKALEQWIRDSGGSDFAVLLGKGLYSIAYNRLRSKFMGYTFGGVGVGKSNFAQSVTGAMPMGFSAATDTAAEVLENDGTLGQAIALAGVSFLSETLTEGIELSHMSSAIEAGVDLEKTLGFVLKLFPESISETIGETATDIIGNWSNQLIMGDKSDHKKLVDSFILQGYMPEEAEILAQREETNGYLFTAITSALGPGMDLISYGSARFRTNRYYKHQQKEYARNGVYLSIPELKQMNKFEIAREKGEVKPVTPAAKQETQEQATPTEQAATETTVEQAPVEQTPVATPETQETEVSDPETKRFITDSQMLAAAENGDNTQKTIGIATALEVNNISIRGTEGKSGDVAIAAATHIQEAFGEGVDAVDAVRTILDGARQSEKELPIGYVKLGITFAALSENSESRRVAQSEEFKNATPPEKARMMAEAAFRDTTNDTVSGEAKKQVDATQIAENMKLLMAEGALDSVEDAKANAESAKAETQAARKQLEQKETEQEVAGQNLQAATEALVQDPTPQNVNAQKSAAAEVRARAEVVNEYQQKVENAEQKQSDAEAKAERAQQDALMELRKQAIANTEQQNQQAEAKQARLSEEEMKKKLHEKIKKEVDSVAVMDADSFINWQGLDVTDEEREQVRNKFKAIYQTRLDNAIDRRNEFIKKMGDKFGLQINVKDLSEGGTIPDYLVQNGYMNPVTGEITLDDGSTIGDAVRFVLGHEIMHIAEKSETYKELANAVLQQFYGDDIDYASVLEQMEKGDFSSRLANDILNTKKNYDRHLPDEAAKGKHTYEYILQEVVADRMGDLLHMNEAQANRLVEKNPNLARRILESIKSFMQKMAGMDGDWRPDIENVMNLLEKSLKNATAKEANPEGKVIAKGNNGQPIAQELRGGTVIVGPEDIRNSLKSFTQKEQDRVRQALLATGNFTEQQVDEYMENALGIAKTIAADRQRLDFEASDNQVFLKPNADYYFTLDASSLCAKRLLYQGTFNYVQHEMPDEVFTPEDLIDLVNIMNEMGYETPCGICYVESRRRWLDTYAQEFLDKLPENADDFIAKYFEKATDEDKAAIREGFSEEKPSIDDLTTSDGLENLRHKDPYMYKAFVAAMNAKGSANPKLVQLRTEYRGDIAKMTAKEVQKVKDIGGLRIQSFSDFETPHLLDMVQAVMDMSAVGLTSQAYTKVSNFAWVFGDTGIKINLSLIGKGTGLDENGNLVFDNREGINFDEAMKLRERYNQNVGTILVGINDEHIIAAMGDPRIDFIIPFHKSGWSAEELRKMPTLNNYNDYTATQNEMIILGPKVVTQKGKGQKAVDNWIAKHGDEHPGYQIIEEGNGKFTIQYRDGYVTESFATHKERTGEKLSNLEPVGAHKYWDFKKSGQWNAENYLRMCAEQHRTPKFYQFLVDNGDGSFSLPQGKDKRSTAIREGYWKTLIDFKMYENDGYGRTKEDGTMTEVKGSEQQEVTPNINMAEAYRVLGDYQLGRQMPNKADGTPGRFIPMESNNSVPVATPAGDRFIEVIKARRAGNKPEGPGPDTLEADYPAANLNRGSAFGAYQGDMTLGNTPSAQEEYAQKRNAMAINAETGEVETLRRSLKPNNFDEIQNEIDQWFEEYIDGLSAEELNEFSKELFNIDLNKPSNTDETPVANAEPAEIDKTSAEQFVTNAREAYMNAVNSGDIVTAQGIVDKLAKKAGYTVRGTHRTNAKFTVFDRSKQTKKNGATLGDGFYVAAGTGTEYDNASYGKNRMLVYINPGNVFNIQDGGLSEEQAKEVYDKYFAPYHPNAVGDDNPYTQHVITQLQKSYKVMDYIKEAAENAGVTTDVIFKELGYDSIKDGPQYNVFDPEQIKSANPITYDDQGNAIDLGSRFDKSNPDIRYSLPNGTEEKAVYIPNGKKEDGTEVDFINEMLDKNGHKKYETRKHNKLIKSKSIKDGWVGLTRGGKGPSVVGRVQFGDPIPFQKYEADGKTPTQIYQDSLIEGTEYDMGPDETRYAYPILDREDFRNNPRPVVTNSPGLASYRYSIKPSDAPYLSAVDHGNVDEANYYVQQAAEKNGFDTENIAYHGTRSFGFTEFDIDSAEMRGMIFVSYDPDVARTYTDNAPVREVGRGKKDFYNMFPSELVKELKADKVAKFKGSRFESAEYVTQEQIREELENTFSKAVDSLSGMYWAAAATDKETLVEMAADETGLPERVFESCNSLQEMAEFLVNRIINGEARNEEKHNTLSYILRAGVRVNLDGDEAQEIQNVLHNIDSYTTAAYSPDSFDGKIRFRTESGETGLLNPSTVASLLDYDTRHGIYEFYTRPGKQLVVDAENNYWHSIPFDLDWEDHMRPDESYDEDWVESVANSPDGRPNRNTRYIAKWAMEHGYGSVRINNIYDKGGWETPGDGYGDIGIFFDRGDVKSADTVTYDDDGNVIPLSERFQTENNDIRYSLPSENVLDEQIRQYIMNGVGKPSTKTGYSAAAAAWSDTELQNLKEIPETMRGPYTLDQIGEIRYHRFELKDDPNWLPQKSASLPNETQTVPTGPQRQFGSIKAQRSNLNELVKKHLRENSDYDPDSNSAQIDRAIAWITSHANKNDPEGYYASVEAVTSPDFDYRSADGQARMLAVMSMAAVKAESAESADARRLALNDSIKIADAYNQQGTDIARMLQARKIFQLMTPLGRIAVLENECKKINDEYAKKGKNTRVHLSNETLEAAGKAKTRKQYENVRHRAAKEIAAQMPPNWRERLNAWRMLSMLANVRTHGRNVVGNLGFMPVVGTKNKIAALMEKAFISPEKRTKTLGFANEEARAFARQDTKEVQDMLTGEAKYNDGGLVQQERNMFKTKALNKLSKANSKALEFEDWLFLSRHYKNALAGYMTARGLTAEQMTGKTLEDARAYAIQEAQKATYRDANELASTLSKIGQKGGATGFVVNAVLPFKKTPANILRRGVEYSPVGLLKSLSTDLYHMHQYNEYEQGKLDTLPAKAISATQWIDKLSSGLTGTAIAALGLLLRSAGFVNAGLDDDDDEFETLRGKQEYSVNIGGMNLTIDWAAPACMPFFVGSTIWDVLQKANGGKKIDPLKLVESLIEISEPVFNLSMLEGVNNLFNVNSYGEGNAITQIGLKIVSNYLTSYVPTFAGQVARTVDPTRRKNYVPSGQAFSTFAYALEQTENKIPFLSKSNIPYRDVWGNTSEKAWYASAGENFLSPAYWSELKDDKLVDELEKVYRNTGSTAAIPKMPGKTIGSGENRIVLTDQQYDQLTVERGTAARTALDELITRPEWLLADDETKADMIGDVWTYANQRANYIVSGGTTTKAAWVEAAENGNPVDAVVERAVDRNKSDYVEGHKTALIESIDSGNRDDALVSITALREAGKDDSSIRSTLTNHYKPIYQQMIRDGEITEAGILLDELYDLDVGYTDDTLNKWANFEDKEEEEKPIDTNWLNRNR